MRGRREAYDSGWSAGRLIVPGLFAAAVYFAVFGGEYSIFELRDARAQLQVEEQRLSEVSERIDSLATMADRLEHDPATIERVAREEYGMIRDGETLYRFADADESDDDSPASEAPPAR